MSMKEKTMIHGYFGEAIRQIVKEEFARPREMEACANPWDAPREEKGMVDCAAEECEDCPQDAPECDHDEYAMEDDCENDPTPCYVDVDVWFVGLTDGSIHRFRATDIISEDEDPDEEMVAFYLQPKQGELQKVAWFAPDKIVFIHRQIPQ